MTKLIVFWQFKSMSKYVAGKAQCEGKKEYKVKQCKSEFVGTTSPDQAFEEIYDRFGRRPETRTRSYCAAHSFAEIVSYRYAEVKDKEHDLLTHGTPRHYSNGRELKLDT